MSEILAIGAWRDNADLMVDVAALGYFHRKDGTPATVLDATYGEGAFWRIFEPPGLVTNDRYKPARFDDDYRALRWADGDFDVVVFDPPYKLSGTPALGEFDHRYGIQHRMTRDERLADIVAGALECYRVCARFLLVKCQDQVEGGKVRWQTDIVTRAVEGAGGRKVDRFDLSYTPRPQPGGRRQLTARRNHSSLLVFGK